MTQGVADKKEAVETAKKLAEESKATADQMEPKLKEISDIANSATQSVEKKVKEATPEFTERDQCEKRLKEFKENHLDQKSHHLHQLQR